MATPFQDFVNRELPKRPFTQDASVAWTQGRVLVTTGVALGVTTEEFPAPPVLSVNSGIGDVVITAASISAIPTSQKGAASGVASLDANGFVPMSQMNPGVVERLYVVTDEAARFALTTAQVQNGDVVKQELPAPAAMYYVQDDTNLDSELGYAIFAVGTAAAVAWSGVTGVPQILLDLENISGAVTGDILQFDGTNWVKQSRNAYVSALNLQTSEIEGLDTALGDKQDHDLTLDALSNLPDIGFIVQTAADTFTSRVLEAGDGINITFEDGVGGNPLIALMEGPAGAAGTHGDENTYLGLDIDSHGRTTAVTEYKLQKDIVYIPNSTDPFTLETKTQYMIGDFSTTTYGDLYLQLPPLTASTILEIQLTNSLNQIGQVNLIPNGTDLIFGAVGTIDVSQALLPSCTFRLFYLSPAAGWAGTITYSEHYKYLNLYSTFSTNSTNYAAKHSLVSHATSGHSLSIPDVDLDLGQVLTSVAFDSDTSVLTALRADGTESTTTIQVNYFSRLFDEAGAAIGTPLQVGYSYRPIGAVPLYTANTPLYLPAATTDAFNSAKSRPIRIFIGNHIIGNGYLRLTPQVGDNLMYATTTGTVLSGGSYILIPNFCVVTCYMVQEGVWYVDIQQDSTHMDTEHLSIVDSTDRTKSLKLNVAPITTGNQRTLTVPDADVSLGKVPTGVTPTYTTGRLMVPLADGTSLPLSAFGGTRLANLSSPATVLTANGHYLFYSNTGSYYTVICGLALPTAPADMTYVRISNISSLGSFSVGAGATVAPGGADKINGVAATLDITDYLVNYRNAVITFTYSTLHENWTVSVLGDLVKPGTVAIYDADKTNTATLTPVTNLTTNRVITLPDANVDLGKVLSNISYAPTTGVITLTNVDASTFATTNIGAIADDMLRIQATGAATKKMGFDCSPVTAGQTRIVTMPDANVDLGKVGKLSPFAMPTSAFTAALNNRYTLENWPAGAVDITMPPSPTLGDTFSVYLGVVPSVRTVTFYKNGNDFFISGNAATSYQVPASFAFCEQTWIYDGSAWIAEQVYHGGSSRTNAFILNATDGTKKLRFNTDALTTGATRTITMPDRDVDLGNVTSSTTESGAFVYATGMGSVVKTITGSGTTFNIDALASNKAHSVTIRNNGDSTYPFNTTATFQFVSAKPGLGFDYSGFVDAQGLGLFESTYISNGAPLTVTLEPNESIEVRYIGGNGAGGELFSMQRNLIGLVTIPSSATSFKLYPERRYALPFGYAGALTLQLPLVDRVGTSITLEDVVGASASTITSLTIVAAGSQMVSAVASTDIKNFIDNGCTVKLVMHSPNQWVYNVQYSSVIRGNTLGVRNTAGALTSFNVSAATASRTVTFPDANVDLSQLRRYVDLPSGIASAQPNVNTLFKLNGGTSIAINVLSGGKSWEFYADGDYNLDLTGIGSGVLLDDEGNGLQIPFTSYTIAMKARTWIRVTGLATYWVVEYLSNRTFTRSGSLGLVSTTGAGASNTKYKTTFVRSSGAAFPTDTTVTLPDADVDLGQMVTPALLRYSINAQTGTTYTVLNTDVNAFGNKILKLTNAAAIAVTLPTPAALGATVGDSFNIRQGGAGSITITGTVSGANTTTAINTTMTLIAESSTSWMSVGG